MALTTIRHYEKEAAKKLEPDVEKFVSGRHNRQTFDNVEAFDKYLIRPYLAIDTSSINTTTTMLGHQVSMPLCIAPMGGQHSSLPTEHVTASAAKKCNVGFSMSAWATVAMEELVERSDTGLKFLNLYIFKDKSWIEHVVRKAEKCGFHGLILGFGKMNPAAKASSIRARYMNLEDILPSDMTPEHRLYPLTDHACSWKDVCWLKTITSLPVIVKGVLSARDAVQAVNSGADAILVSNHGGRQLQGVPAPIEVLAEVAAVVRNRCEVYLDGGVRTGQSLFKALSLGAKAVFVGRPILWGYACEGKEGVEKVLNIYRQELTYTMLMAGVTDVNKVPADAVVRKDMLAKL